MSRESIDNFKMIASCSDAQARNYLARYNQDFERSIQAWYEMGPIFVNNTFIFLLVGSKQVRFLRMKTKVKLKCNL
jgi:hypothetical protein